MNVLYQINRLLAIHALGQTECEYNKQLRERQRNSPFSYSLSSWTEAPAYITFDVTREADAPYKSVAKKNCGHEWGQCFDTENPPDSIKHYPDIIAKLSWPCYLIITQEKTWCEFLGGANGKAEANIPGLAVGIAALLALGVEIPNMEEA